MDIAAISFFADYETQPEEGFVYLKNSGNLKFLPFTIPGSESGRWLTMDAGDIDGDGWEDIVLGNFTLGPVKNKKMDQPENVPPFLILKNIHNSPANKK